MKTIIIAEAGVNHNGSFELAKKLIDTAKEAGSDYIKFQTFKTELIISKQAKKTNYQIANTADENESQFEMVKKLELSFEDFENLKKYCDEIGIGFLSTGFDFPSIQFLNELNIDFFKIPSGEITNFPYLAAIAKLKKPIILSTGMSSMDEIEDAVNFFIELGVDRNLLTILHCNTEYPTPMEDVNLRAMLTIGAHFKVKFGYSDHTEGIEIPIAAVALGAQVIEKHFTLDKTMEGPDHKASLEPQELKAMVKAIRNIELALGDGRKKPSKSESSNIAIVRKSLHLNRPMKKGEQITLEHLVTKRPGDGIPTKQMSSLIGKKVNADLPEEHKISLSDLE